MKIIVAGPRDYTNYKFVELKIAMIWSMYKKNASNIEIVEGGAKGVDSLAKQVALTHKLSLKEFPADWNKYGHSAGPIRNSQLENVRKHFFETKYGKVRYYVMSGDEPISIDAWFTTNDNENRHIIAQINQKTKHVEYFDNDAIFDPYAQEIIQKVLQQL